VAAGLEVRMPANHDLRAPISRRPLSWRCGECSWKLWDRT